MRVAFLDCHAGVAGDMWVAAFLDAGLPLAEVQALVASLGLPGVTVGAERVRRAGLAACRFVVTAAEPSPAHRHLDDVLAIVERAELPDAARRSAVATFEALADAEAAAHAVAREAVHFHEVGADDTIVDIVAACFAVHRLGVERLYASTVEVGSGTVTCEHGVLPVPAPGALRCLLGVPVRRTLEGERTTPTGAALLRVLVDAFEPPLEWTLDATGSGAGARDDPGLPNVLRVTLGTVPEAGVEPDCALLEIACNLDTASGEHLGWLLERAFERGAVDAWLTPVTMKKGRPGQVFTVLAPAERRAELCAFLLEESTSLGVRLSPVAREVLERWEETREGPLGAVRFKCARLPSGAVVCRPEADEVARLCAAHGLTRREVEERLRG